MDKQLEKPLNVGIIFDDLMIGGWTTIASVIPKFDRQKISPFAVCLFGKGYHADELEKKGINVFFLNANKFNVIFKILSLAWFLNKNRIDVVNTQLAHSHVIGQLAALIAGIPARIMHVHTIETRLNGIWRILLDFVAKRSTMIIPVSEAAEKSFRGIYPFFKGESRIIYNGIDIKDFRRRLEGSRHKREDFGIGEGAFCAITVANLKWQKGHKYLVEAAAILKDDGIRFVFVGDGPERKELEDMIRRNGLEKQFIFLGKREDVPEIIHIADILILPSVHEGFGICIIEAFAAGIPVLTTDIHGIREIAENDKNAIIVPSANPKLLADAIARLKNDLELRGRLTKKASEDVSRFDISNVVEQYQKAYLDAAQLV